MLMQDIIKDVSKKCVHCIINSKTVSNQNRAVKNRAVRKNLFHSLDRIKARCCRIFNGKKYNYKEN